MFRTCSLAVLNCGSDIDDARQLQQKFSSFKIKALQVERGLWLELHNAPAIAFVEGKMIKGIKEHLFSVLRDIIYVNNEISNNPRFNLRKSKGTTDTIFHILRNAGTLRSRIPSNTVVFCGGHSIERHEYDYTKDVGYELGLRGMDICTGCGAGAIKGPMKGATIGHAKQRIRSGCYIGITEPGIISSEAPNPIVNELVILPDIEKRLEAFVRIAHGITIFLGGVGTIEEILYLLGVLLHPKNKKLPFPIVFIASEHERGYIERVDRFIGQTLEKRAQDRYKIIIDDPVKVANTMLAGLHGVRKFRKANGDAFFFDWTLKMYRDFQQPFLTIRKNVTRLNICKDQPTYKLAADLRRVFSSIIAGNVKEQDIRAIEEHENYQLKGEPEIMAAMDELPQSCADEKRMKLAGHDYSPCYEIVSNQLK